MDDGGTDALGHHRAGARGGGHRTVARGRVRRVDDGGADALGHRRARRDGDARGRGDFQGMRHPQRQGRGIRARTRIAWMSGIFFATRVRNVPERLGGPHCRVSILTVWHRVERIRGGDGERWVHGLRGRLLHAPWWTRAHYGFDGVGSRLGRLAKGLGPN